MALLIHFTNANFISNMSLSQPISEMQHLAPWLKYVNRPIYTCMHVYTLTTSYTTHYTFHFWY